MQDEIEEFDIWLRRVGTLAKNAQARRDRDAKSIQRRIEILKNLVEQIDLEIGFEAPSLTAASTFWDDIHPSITRVAKGRYEACQFADCVEAALKEINSLVKDHVKRRTGNELDGAPLMNKAFSPKDPLVVLDDLSTESGRNNAHANVTDFPALIEKLNQSPAFLAFEISSEKAVEGKEIPPALTTSQV